MQTADWHLGNYQYQLESRLLDFIRAAYKVQVLVTIHKPDVLILAGDAFDSPDPDPLSSMVFRRIMEQLHAAFPNMLILVNGGNHDRYQDKVKGSVSRTQSLMPNDICRTKKVDLISKIYSEGEQKLSLNVVVADWMPSSEIEQFLEELPKDLDLLVMHQSCSAFTGGLFSHEVSKEQLDGKAKYVAIGDTHVCRVTDTGETVIASSGPIEMTKSNEAPEKFVLLASFDLLNRRVVNVEQIPILSRTQKTIELTTPEEVSQLKLEEIAKESPVLFLSYEASLKDTVKELAVKLREMGVENVIVSKLQTREVLEIKQVQLEGHADMSSVISEMLADCPDLIPVMLDLWKNPRQADSILDAFQKSVLA